MNDRTKTGLEILEAALLLGVLGDVLLRETPWGLNVFLWITVLAAAMVALTLRRKKNFGVFKRLGCTLRWLAVRRCSFGAIRWS